MSTATRTMNQPVLLRFGNRFQLTRLHFDLAVITLWFSVTTVQFRYDELLLYPMALYFTFAFFRDWHATWPVLKRGFVLLLLPSWWILSTLWSPEPALAFRSGLQVFLTILICMFMASHLNTRQLLAAVLIALSIAALRSMPQALIDLSVGKPSKAIYPHKNSLGLDMSILWVTALALLLMPQVMPLVRRMAALVLPVALLLVFASQSATAILISLGMAGVLVGGLTYFGRSNIITFPRLSAIAFTIGVAAVGLALTLNLAPVDPVAFVLDSLGKDRTLTGRTDLWEIAVDEIAERPLLGTGAKGYWRYYDSSLVRQIFIDHYKTVGNVFHFHNSWLELSVNLGLVGAALAALGVGWGLFVLVRCVVLTGGPQNWALLAIALSVLVRTMTEADLFAQFIMLHMLLWTGVLILARQSP